MASAMSASSGRPWAIVSSAFHVSDETLTKMLRSPPVICGKGCTLSAAASTVACALSRASLRSGIYLPPPGSLGDCRLRRQGRRVRILHALPEPLDPATMTAPEPGAIGQGGRVNCQTPVNSSSGYPRLVLGVLCYLASISFGCRRHARSLRYAGRVHGVSATGVSGPLPENQAARLSTTSWPMALRV